MTLGRRRFLARARRRRWPPRWPRIGQPRRAAGRRIVSLCAQRRAMARTLSREEYEVLRREATERPYSSPLNNEHRKGLYTCAGCAHKLFSSDRKFDSGTGWPSFWQPLPDAVGETEDRTFGMVRTAVHCANCGGHLGHVFDDGPRPTGLRYCMNGVALRFTAQS